MSESPSVPGTMPPQFLLLWAALLASIGMYIAVCFVVADEPAAGELPDVMLIIFGVVAAVDGVAAMLIVPVFMRAADFFVLCIVRWALAESVALFGVVVFFLGRDWAKAAGFFVASALLLIILMPTRTAYEDWQHKRSRN